MKLDDFQSSDDRFILHRFFASSSTVLSNLIVKLLLLYEITLRKFQTETRAINF